MVCGWSVVELATCDDAAFKVTPCYHINVIFGVIVKLSCTAGSMGRDTSCLRCLRAGVVHQDSIQHIFISSYLIPLSPSISTPRNELNVLRKSSPQPFAKCGVAPRLVLPSDPHIIFPRPRLILPLASPPSRVWQLLHRAKPPTTVPLAISDHSALKHRVGDHVGRRSREDARRVLPPLGLERPELHGSRQRI